MSNEQYEGLLERAKSLKFYPDPSMEKSFTINTDILSPSQISGLALNFIQSYRIIKLKASMKTIKERIIKRGRPCELEHYSDDYLNFMIETSDS